MVNLFLKAIRGRHVKTIHSIRTYGKTVTTVLKTFMHLSYNFKYLVLRYTRGKNSSTIYSIVLQWPDGNLLNSACLDKLDIESIVMLDTQSKLKVIYQTDKKKSNLSHSYILIIYYIHI